MFMLHIDSSLERGNRGNDRHNRAAVEDGNSSRRCTGANEFIEALPAHNVTYVIFGSYREQSEVRTRIRPSHPHTLFACLPRRSFMLPYCVVPRLR